MTATLQRLNQSVDDSERLHEDATVLLRHMPRLTTRPGQIQQLRQTVLTLAVRGQLVRQDAEDEPASDLLKRIKAERPARAVKKGQLQQEPGPLSDSDDGRFRTPVTWKWARLGALLVSSFYGPRFGADEYAETGVPTIRIADMTADGRIVLQNPPRVRVPPDRIDDFKCVGGDLLVTRTGSIGTMAVFSNSSREYVCEETGDEVVLMKDVAERVIGFEKLNFSVPDPKRFRVTFETTPA